MTLHIKWDDVKEDAASLAGVAKNAYDLWESIIDKHPDAKLYVRCANCAGSIYFMIDRLQKHYFNSTQKPAIACTCPNCGKQIDQHSMTYNKVART